MTMTLSDNEIEAALSDLPDWEYSNDKLSKTFLFKDFKQAITFIVRLSFEAEQLNHHPEIVNVYSRVSISLSTHDSGNKVTAKDVTLAQIIERLGS